MFSRICCPELGQVLDVLPNLFFGLAFRFGAQDESEAVRVEFLSDLAQAFAFGAVFDFARDAQPTAFGH
jgi:hypothetical protein